MIINRNIHLYFFINLSDPLYEEQELSEVIDEHELLDLSRATVFGGTFTIRPIWVGG